MFKNLSERLGKIFSKLTSRGKLNEKDVDEALREIRLALLEADVNFKVVKDFIAKVREKAVGREVLESLTPGQQVIKIVRDELAEVMGGTSSKVSFSPRPPTVIMLVGLQGSGKTTATAKLANYFKKRGKNPLMVAADIYRPAAIDQLKTLGDELKLEVYRGDARESSIAIARAGVKRGEKEGFDLVLVDTAGRLHIDKAMMEELKETRKTIRPHEILLIVDAMTGQDAVNIASAFEKDLGFDGVVLTKLDGDARGGAALSIKAVAGKPIKFASVGEKLDDLDLFYPERLASRTLGMGDVLSLIEKAEKAIDKDEAKFLEEKIRKEELTLDDFLTQLRQVKKMGSFGDILKMLPGQDLLSFGKETAEVGDKEISVAEVIIQSMTPGERKHPNIIDGSRRSRIAKGSGTSISSVNRLLKQFQQAKKLLRQFKEGKIPFRGGRKAFPFV